MNLVPRMWALGSLLAVSAAATAAPPPIQWMGPDPYLSDKDAPFRFASRLRYKDLENFESGKIGALGVTISPGFIVGPHVFRDSVDGDDGAVDGLGRNGHTWAPEAETVTISFNAESIGKYPTHVAAVWTDVAYTTGDYGYAYVTIAIHDREGKEVGSYDFESKFGDGSAIGETGEDRLVGAIWYGGISALKITCVGSSDWEIDHVQYATTCRADADDDGDLDVNDYIGFQRSWRAGFEYGDYNGDKKFDVNDFVEYQRDWKSGCK